MLTDERIVELFDVNDMDDSYQISKKRIVAFARAVEAEVRAERGPLIALLREAKRHVPFRSDYYSPGDSMVDLHRRIDAATGGEGKR